MSKKLLNYIFAICSVILTVFLVEYVNELRESGSMIKFLGAMPNFLAAICGIFIFLPFVEKFEVINYYFYYCIGLTIYEFLQLKMLTQTFDFFDLIATWIGFIAAAFLFKAATSHSLRLIIDRKISKITR